MNKAEETKHMPEFHHGGSAMEVFYPDVMSVPKSFIIKKPPRLPPPYFKLHARASVPLPHLVLHATVQPAALATHVEGGWLQPQGHYH